MTAPARHQLIPLAGLLLTMAAAVTQVAQLDILRADENVAGDIRLIEGGPFEASGVVHVSGSDGVLFVDDGRAREIFWMAPGADGTQQAPAKAITLDADVTDLEGITSDGTFVYVVGFSVEEAGSRRRRPGALQVLFQRPSRFPLSSGLAASRRGSLNMYPN